jgi:hypothetical protein
MLTITDIQNIVEGVLKIEKKTDFGDLPFVKRKETKHEYYEGYWQNVDAMEEIRVHAIRGTYPYRLIEHRAPNMTDAERRYVEMNYKQITLPVSVDWQNTIKRAYADNNWAIEFPNDDGQEGGFRWYVEKGLKKTRTKMSWEEYQKQVVPLVSMIDAMGYIVVKPESIPVEEVDGQMVMSSDLIEPIPHYYSCAQLHSYVDNEYYLFLTDEHSMVEYGNTRIKEGFVYELYDQTAIYKVIQTGRKSDMTFDVIEYYRHDRNEIPVKVLGGIPEYRNGEIAYVSPFSYVVPSLDEAIIDANMLRGVKATTMFPYRVMTGNICEHKMELGGEIKCCDGRGWFDNYDTGVQMKCPSCGGSGLKDRISPYGVMLMKPEQPGDPGELKASQPAMYYVAPSVDVPQFTRDEVNAHIREARRVLHIRDSSTQVKGGEDMTATGMVIDEKALYAFIKPIIDQQFEVGEFILYWIGIERYGEPQEFILTAPITFDFKTEYDYLMEISLAIKNGLPPFVVHTIVLKYLKTLFYNQLESASAFNLIVQSDRLLTMDDEEINMKLARGVISDWEVVLHDSAVSFVMDLVRENPSYFDQDIQPQIDQLVAKAQEVASSTRASRPTSPQSLVNAIASGNAT